MKKTLISVSLLAAMSLSPSAFSVPTPGTLNLQWAGTVPAAAVNGEGFFIIKDGATDFHDGKLIFKNNDGKVTLTGSAEIGFKIVKDAVLGGAYDSAVDISPLSYTAILTNLKVGINSLITEQDPIAGPFVLYANGAPMVIGTATTESPNATLLTVKENPSAVLDKPLKSGDNIDVHAFISVSANVV